MKKKVLEALKNKYSNLGFGEKAFDGVADFLSKTITEEGQIDENVNGVEILLKSFQGDLDKARGEKSQLQKKLDELTKQAPSEEEEIVDPKMPEWAKEMLKNQKASQEENKFLKETIQKLQGNEMSKTRQSLLEETLKGTSEGFGKVVRGSFEHLKNSSEEDYNNWIEGIKANAQNDIESQAAFTPRSGVNTKVKVSDEELKTMAKML